MERLPRAFVEEAWKVLCGFSRQESKTELDKMAAAMEKELLIGRGAGDSDEEATPTPPVVLHMGGERALGSRPIVNFSRTVGANAMGFPHLFARNGMADMTVERSTSIGGHKPWMGQCNVTFWLKD